MLTTARLCVCRLVCLGERPLRGEATAHACVGVCARACLDVGYQSGGGGGGDVDPSLKGAFLHYFWPLRDGDRPSRSPTVLYRARQVRFCVYVCALACAHARLRCMSATIATHQSTKRTFMPHALVDRRLFVDCSHD